jgi:hypothetical protein
MNNLIWIGNTLYPRWIVFAAMAAIPVTFLATDIIVCIVQIVQIVRKRR